MKKVPDSEILLSFSRSSGPGGQNVNKVNTRVTLTWNMSASNLYTEAHKQRLQANFKRNIVDGNVVITSQRFRSQQKNIEDCKQRLYEMLLATLSAPKARKATKPTRSSVNERLQQKKQHGAKKRLRSEKF